MKADQASRTIPLFGARKMARALLAEVDSLGAQRDQLREQLTRLGSLSVLELEAKRADLERDIAEQAARLQRESADAMVKVGMTRRLDPMDRIRELSDASVPFNFDVHALFFSKDAVGIESAMHERLGARRVNLVNQRREFFRATPLEAKTHLAELAGELLQFQDVPDALEYRESLTQAERSEASGPVTPGAA